MSDDAKANAPNATNTREPADAQREPSSPAGAGAPDAMRVFSPAAAPKRPPMFRMVEMVWGDDGRARKEGKIWHPSLNDTRKFARAIAANSASQKILVADDTGQVLEEVSPPGPGERKNMLGSWRDIALPPLPAAPATPRRLRPPPVPVLTDSVDFVLGDAPSVPPAPAPSKSAPSVGTVVLRDGSSVGVGG